MAEPATLERLRPYGGLACLLVFVIGGVALLVGDVPQPLRAVLGAGLVVWAPGYALTMVAFAPGAISAVERALLTFGLSLATTAITAVALEAVGVRLDTTSFAVTACVVISVAGAVAVWRLPTRDELPSRERRGRIRPLHAAVGLAVGIVLAAALTAARVPPQAANIEGYSAFAVTSAGAQALQVEVISAELHTTAYKVVSLADGRAREVARFRLRPGGSWRRRIARPAGSPTTEVFLYRGIDKLPYRRVAVAGAPA